VIADRNTVSEQVRAILAELIAIDSTYPPGDTRAIAAWTAQRLARAGYSVETVAAVPEIANVVARIGAGRPSLVFNVHYDTVGVGERAAWSTDPFDATVNNGRVFGLGAGNCKGSMAAQLWAAEALARAGGPAKGEVVFTFVGDEESLGSNGLAHLRASGAVKPDMLVVGAQTENRLVIAERGVLWTRIRARGRAAHAGAAPSGDSAILRMLRLIAHLQSTLAPAIAARTVATPYGTTLQSMINIGRIRGGANTNMVPDLCEIEIDRRLLPAESTDAAFAELRDAALQWCEQVGEPAGTIEVERITGSNGFFAGADGPCVRAFAGAVESVTGAKAGFLDVVGVFDGRWFAADGIEILDFGPGEGAEGHKPDESIPLDQLGDAALIQFEAIRSLLGLRT